MAQGRLEDAVDFHQRGLAARERAGGGEVSLVRGLNGLAHVRQLQGDERQAEALYRRSITIADAAASAKTPERPKALNNLAALLGSQGRTAEAEHLYLRALAVLESLGGPPSEDMGRVLRNLAAVCLKNGKPDDARRFLRRAGKFPESGETTRTAATAW